MTLNAIMLILFEAGTQFNLLTFDVRNSTLPFYCSQANRFLTSVLSLSLSLSFSLLLLLSLLFAIHLICHVVCVV